MPRPWRPETPCLWRDRLLLLRLAAKSTVLNAYCASSTPRLETKSTTAGDCFNRGRSRRRHAWERRSLELGSQFTQGFQSFDVAVELAQHSNILHIASVLFPHLIGGAAM